ncbi:MAG: hypothetical protein ABI624_24625, partial [Casimicrobiaceae bacterium]
MDLVVIKIGGSLMRSDAAARLLTALVDARGRRLAIVPGGGTFADAVRRAQSQHGLSESAAHHMALLAMDMSACMLADLSPALVVARTAEAFQASWSGAMTPIWAPMQMASVASDIPHAWEMTSDSLAAWLAQELGATRLVVVKSCAVPEARRQDAAGLAEAGIVDRCFPRFVSDRNFAWQVVSGAAAA